MKPNDIHDAIGNLPDDLVVEVDKIRNAKKRRSLLKPIAVLAACMSLIIVCSFAIPAIIKAPAGVNESGDVILENGTEGKNDGDLGMNFEILDAETSKGDVIENTPSLPEVKAENVYLSSTMLNATDSSFTPDDTQSDTTPADNLKFSIAATDFSLKLFRETATGNDNEMISPLSVMYALAMASNGAKGETLAQIESVMGMTVDDMNLYLSSYIKNLPNGEKYFLSVANSFWMRDSYSEGVTANYLIDLRNYYNADVLSAPFNADTVKDINDWVSDKTDGMIENAVSDVSDLESILINAVSFEADWQVPFAIDLVKDKVFTTANGSEVTAKLMTDRLYPSSKNYFENENSKGFIKYYKDQKYAFVAMLPNEGVTLEEYINTLNGETVNSLITNAEGCYVNISLPKFESKYENSITDELGALGIKDAFDPSTADFSGINPTFHVYISNAVHKTYIKVHEKGTKSGSLTAIDLAVSDATNDGIKEVHLDRPFVYMIIDCENSVPLFFGTVTDPTK